MKAARKLVVQTGARAMSSTEMDEYGSMCFVGATADKVFVHFNTPETEIIRHRASARRALLPRTWHDTHIAECGVPPARGP
jgi:hypothetical protein